MATKKKTEEAATPEPDAAENETKTEPKRKRDDRVPLFGDPRKPDALENPIAGTGPKEGK